MSSDPPSAADNDPPRALPRGTRLGEFEVRRVLGAGGFGIVYLAFDHALERDVAIKEYMPATLAGRSETLHVSLRSRSDADTFTAGLKSFVNEARLLARFDHPSLLKVHRFWEANSTAYMAMPVLGGRTLKDARAAMALPPGEAWLRTLLEPLLGAIERLHDEGVYHRDIAPDNVVLEAGGRPVLLDFGAARRVIGDKSQALTAILKPAYAPIEQYAEVASLRQGPWTDIYALGATLHFLLLGQPPAPATARAVHDDHPPLAGQALAGCSQAFLRTVDWMLAPRPTDRPQSVAALRAVLEGRVAPPVRRALVAQPSPWERTQVLDADSPPPAAAAAAAGQAALHGHVPTVVVPRKASSAPAVATDEPAARSPVTSAVPEQGQSAPATASPGGARHRSATPGPGGAVVAPPPTRPLHTRLSALAAVLLACGAGAYFLRPAPAPAVVAAADMAASAAGVGVPTLNLPKAAEAGPAAATAETAAAASAAPPPLAPPEAAGPVLPARADAVAPQPRAPGETRPPGRAPAMARTAPARVLPATDAPQPPAAETAPPEPAAASAEPPPAAAAAPDSPTQRCGARVLVSLWLCIERECGKPELAQHAQCRSWRDEQERKANPDR